MYGHKIWVVGVTMILAAPLLPVPIVVGQVIALFGAVLVCLDK